MNVILGDRCLEEAMDVSGKRKSNTILQTNPREKFEKGLV